MIASSRPFLPVLVRREHASLTVKLVAPPVALGLATLLNLGLYVLMGRDPVAVFHAMLLEPFLSWVSFS
ncbi:ABC transporter permease, partial [Mesorhizobium sp. M2E.F.Ca.ET.219.01.1.1]